MTNNHKRDACNEALTGRLADDQLEKASGGQAVVAPRDSVSGNATGRRAYKPVL